MRRTFLALALLTALAPPPAHATSPVALAGITTVVAPAAGSVHLAVRVPRTVTLPAGYLDPEYVAFSGSADLVLLYLVPAAPRPLLTEPVLFGRTQAVTGAHRVAGFPHGGHTIAAGMYDLVLLHTPGTATVRLALPGLRGRVTLRPARASTARVAPLADPAHLPVGTSDGAYASLAGTGFVQVGAVVTSGPGVNHLSVCLKRPGDVTPPPADFAPECPGLRSIGFLVTQGSVSYNAGTFLNYAPGRYGAAFTYEFAGLPTAAAGFAAWIPV